MEASLARIKGIRRTKKSKAFGAVMQELMARYGGRELRITANRERRHWQVQVEVSRTSQVEVSRTSGAKWQTAGYAYDFVSDCTLADTLGQAVNDAHQRLDKAIAKAVLDQETFE